LDTNKEERKRKKKARCQFEKLPWNDSDTCKIALVQQIKETFGKTRKRKEDMHAEKEDVDVYVVKEDVAGEDPGVEEEEEEEEEEDIIIPTPTDN
jgi:hypothetical protein